MDNNDFKAEVLSQLSIGISKAIRGKVLASRLGLKDSRPARLAIRELWEYWTNMLLLL